MTKALLGNIRYCRGAGVDFLRFSGQRLTR
jgi:hypothetical protein